MTRRLSALILIAAGCASGAPTPPTSGLDPAPGLQLYSLRDEIKQKGIDAGLDRAKKEGITLLEGGSTYGLTAAAFNEKVAARGMKCVSGHFSYARWKSDPDAVVADAKALGLEHAGCAWADHQDPLDEGQAREIAAVFNKAGAAAAKQGIKFFYHFHGFEFGKHGNGTLADLIARETDPKLVSFQLDVLWVVFPGQDPVAWLERYPGRWLSMHLKDLKKGVATGSLTGHTDVRYNVVLGTGQVDWPAVFRAAKKVGVKYYFIEDESPDVATQLPLTLRYLRQGTF